MAWYYGVNNSDLYGSNFSSVLADAPPPLDDTYDEDDNEIVFRNDVNKSKKYGEKPVASPVKKTNSNEEKFTGGSVLKHDTEGVKNVKEDEESGFGVFASFADFGSAFGQDNGSGEPQGWFTNNDDNEKSFKPRDTQISQLEQSNNVENGDDEYAGFAAFQGNEDSLNVQENLPNGSYPQGNSASDWMNKSTLKNDNVNGSYDLESYDDFGDFASTEETVTSPRENMHENVDNGDITDKKSVASPGEPTVNFNTKISLYDASKNNCDSHGESLSERSNKQRKEKVTAQDVSLEKLSHSLGSNPKDQESSQLGSIYREVIKCEITTNALTHSEEGVKSNNGEHLTKENSNNVNTQNFFTKEKDAAVFSPEHAGPKNDDFGEFADANDHCAKKSSIYNSNHKDIFHKETGTCSLPVASEGKSEKVHEAEIDSLHAKNASTDDKYNSDDDFRDFGSLEKIHDKHDETSSESIEVHAKLTEAKVLKENPFDTGASAAQDKDSDIDFGNNFGAFRVNQSEKDERTGDVNINSQSLFNKEKDDHGFGGFSAFDSNSSGLHEDKNHNDSVENFSTFDIKDRPLQTEDQNGHCDSINSGAIDSQKDDQSAEDFGDFGNFESSVKDSQINGESKGDFGGFSGFESDTKSFQKKNENADNSGDFGSFEANFKNSEPCNENIADFGGFGSFEANIKDSDGQNENADELENFGSFKASFKDAESRNENADDFGEFGSLESIAKDFGRNTKSDFGDFGAFNSQDSIKKDDGDNDFGEFGGFETTKETVSEQNKDLVILNHKGSKTSTNKGNREIKQSAQTCEIGAAGSNSKNLGRFSHGGDNKSGGFDSFSSSSTSLTAGLGSSSGKRLDLQQQETKVLQHFSPSTSVMIKQVRGPISECFTGELKNTVNSRCTILSSRVEKSLHSNQELWQHLDHAENERRILFSWSNSFSQHKKFLSLCICPERPPPLQVGSMLKPAILSSQFPPFGRGLPGTMLMPGPPSTMPQFSSGLDFLEPLKGSQVPMQSPLQDKESVQSSSHTMALPDLSFIMGNSLKRTTSKSDFKDNISDTASESSSLDLDFFAPSLTQPHDGKTESRGLYEEDLLGFNISLPSAEPRKLDSPIVQKALDTKKVWQHWGVTIPLSSQQNQARLSAAAKNILGQLEDLAFMNSPVLMFPLKPE